MLSYIHIYHAGCAADVFKHTVLALILGHLRAKDKPFTVLDTHAGRGVYDLGDERALMTGEADDGIRRIASYAAEHEIPAVLKPYLSVEREVNGGVYYGSPMIAASMMRGQDTLVLCELHPAEIGELRRNMKMLQSTAHEMQSALKPAVHIHHRDGWEAAVALTPPTPRRGLLFIDPSYEDTWEYAKAAETITAVLHRWPQAGTALWYPVLDKRTAEREEMLSNIQALVPQEKMLVIEMATPHHEIAADGGQDAGQRIRAMRASGMLVINPPYRLGEEVQAAVQFLRAALG